MLNDNFPVMPHQSTMSGKLIGFKSISNNTLKNKFCYDNYIQGKIENKKAGAVVNICGVCYSQEMLQGVRKNVSPALDRNEYLAERLLNDNEVPTILQAYYRLNAHGELLTEVINDNGEVIKTYPKFNHIENYCKIAEKNPHCTFALWSKRTDIIKPFFNKRKKPGNLILIYSVKKTNSILKKIPKHFDKTFNNVAVDNFVNEQNCTGQKCKDCLLCYKKDTTNIIVEKIKKY
jgi:hypothetical protein|tara:strand:+ start:211 stop:909 length:699 start_codon:yes stop_codon:yes gene_type:complete